MCTYNEVAKMLANQAYDVARRLLPNGEKQGPEWCVGNINGEKGQSLKIRLSGDKAGRWSDFATGGDLHGDLLDLWSKTRHMALEEAYKEACQFLGVSTTPKFEAHKPKSFTRPQLKATKLVPSSQVMNYLMCERMLTTETLQAFQVGELGREIVFNYFRENSLIFVKYLHLDRPKGKKQMHTEPGAEPCLFGWQALQPGLRKIALTEGEIDAMTLHQYGIPALSVPFGGGAGDKQRWVDQEFDRLSVFDEIYLCFDPDLEGKAAINELIGRLGRTRCRIVNLPQKDPNACLQAGIDKDVIHECFNNARTLDPEELKNARDFVEQVCEEFYPTDGQEPGILPPWDKAHGKILFRQDDLSVWTGINGHGKSQFLGQVALHSMMQGARVCIASLELKPKRLLWRLTRQAAGLALPSIEYIHSIHDWYSDKLWLFDLVGTAKTKRLLEVFIYARQRYGINVFIIDSFLKLDIAEDDLSGQKACIELLCDFKNQYNCHIHIIVHPRKGLDEYQQPGKIDIKGSGAIADLADNCFGVFRNKRKEKEIEQTKFSPSYVADQEIINQPDCFWSCTKQRNGSWEGSLGLWFDPNSYQYLNRPDQRPYQLVTEDKNNEITTLI